MEESGLLLYWEKKYFPPTKCDHQEKENQTPASRAMTIYDVAAAFIILGVGILLSTLCCMVEIYCNKYVIQFQNRIKDSDCDTHHNDTSMQDESAQL